MAGPCKPFSRDQIMRRVKGENMQQLVLGTAQFGMDYGATNQNGVPDDSALSEMLELALEHGVEWLDTARAYGNAEMRLGSIAASDRFKIVTKIPSFGQRTRDDRTRRGRFLKDSVEASFTALKTEYIDAVMFHDPQDADDPELVDILLRFREDDRVGAIGVSVYSPDEATRFFKNHAITFLQIPCNILDKRWTDAEFEGALQMRKSMTIHARSVFLQGLLLAQPDFWPEWVENAQAIATLLDRAAEPLSGGRLELCLRHHRSCAWIDGSVIGVTSPAELSEAFATDCVDPLPTDIRHVLTQAAAIAPDRLLDPRRW